MHPYGERTPICPRCSKAVYAAEQVMGPGRKLYHKPCLACTSCNKRLDSFTLLEHDQQPYCKPCHVKLFGTRDLRQANLPHRPDLLPGSPNASPTKFTASPSPGQKFTAPSPIRTHGTGAGNGRVTSPPPILRPNRTLSPTSDRFPRDSPPFEADEAAQVDESLDSFDGPSYAGTTTNTHRGPGGLPRTVPLSPTKDRSALPSDAPRSPTKFSAVTLGRSNSSSEREKLTSPLMPTATGTRYGAALGGTASLVPTATGARQWGAATPKCPRCGKNVYFAEQVKATGKTWHKGCLRCTECNTTLDSSRLTEKDGNPLCHRCYGKLHGPQGSGYALLGKAGG